MLGKGRTPKATVTSKHKLPLTPEQPAKQRKATFSALPLSTSPRTKANTGSRDAPSPSVARTLFPTGTDATEEPVADKPSGKASKANKPSDAPSDAPAQHTARTVSYKAERLRRWKQILLQGLGSLHAHVQLECLQRHQALVSTALPALAFPWGLAISLHEQIDQATQAHQLRKARHLTSVLAATTSALQAKLSGDPVEPSLASLQSAITGIETRFDRFEALLTRCIEAADNARVAKSTAATALNKISALSALVSGINKSVQ